MKKLIHIGGDSRTGGSLVARLFDGHPSILSYPFENEFFKNRNHELIKFNDYRETGNVSDIEKVEVVKKIKKFAKDVLTSKQFYDEDSVEFNYEKFIKLLESRIKNNEADNKITLIYDAIHYAFFKVFNPTIDFNDSYAVCNHCSRTFLGNLDSFFSIFSNGFFLHTIRDAKSVCASMKNYSLLVSEKPSVNLPSDFVEDVLNRWMLSLLVGLNNKDKYGDRYIIISYEKLVKNPGEYIAILCKKLMIPYNEGMLTPKFGNAIWSGNSSFGNLPPTITSDTLYKYKNVLSNIEIEYINSEVEGIEEMLNQNQYDRLKNALIDKIEERLPHVLNIDRSEIRYHFNIIHQEIRNVQVNA